MKLSGERILLLLGAVLLVTAGCSTANQPAPNPNVAAGLPFGGAEKAQIPPEAAAMANFLKAQVAMNAGDHDEALRDYELAAQSDPSNPTLRVKLATLYVRQGRLKDASDQVSAAIASDPQNVEARLLAAGIDSATGNDPEAEAQYKQVLKIDPKSQEAYLYLGTLYAKRGDNVQAAKTFER